MTEKEVYASWIPRINPALKIVNFIQDVVANNVFIVSGQGMPRTLQRIEPSLQDIDQHGGIDRFVVSVDSEDLEFESKLEELMAKVQSVGPKVPVYPIVQHYCFESWALGNRVVGAKRPKDLNLAEYKRQYDVSNMDPARMPSLKDGFNRAQFSEHYLRLLLNDQHKGLTYTKANPSVVCHEKYFDQVRKRHQDTSHISSFHQFIEAFTV